MDYQDLDEAEQARRKKEQIEYRIKNRRSNIFLFCAGAFGILETVLLIFIFFIIEAIFYFRVFHFSETGNLTAFSIIMLVLFFAGIVVGHIIYLKIVRWVIKKWNLKDKLSADLINHYKTKKEILAEKENSFIG